MLFPKSIACKTILVGTCVANKVRKLCRDDTAFYISQFATGKGKIKLTNHRFCQ